MSRTMWLVLWLLLLAPAAALAGEKAKHPADLARERYRQRAGADGRVPMDGLVRAKEHIDDMRAITRDGGLWNWEWLGPGNIGGRIRAILAHPNVLGRLWIGSVSGGIWTTSNGGVSWSPVDDFMANLAVTSLAIDPTNWNILYAATGEGFFNLDALPGAGIFKSTDGGVTWAQLPSTNNTNFQLVNRLAHDPSRTGVLFAVTSTPNRVWRSIDGGGTWNAVLNTGGPAVDVKIHPGNPNKVLAGTQSDLFNFGDVHFSADGGATWTRQTTGAANKLPSNGGRCEVAFASSDTTIYVSMDRNGGEIWRSTDRAATWTLRNTGNNYLGTQGWYDNVIWVDPTNSSFVVVGGIDLWRSPDGGATLTQISDWGQYHLGTSAHADQHALVPIQGYNGTSIRQVFVGNDGGIQSAFNIGTVSNTNGWFNLAHNLGITQFYGGAAAPDGSVILGGAQDNDKLRYNGGGTGSWFQAETGDAGYSAIDFTNSSILYGEYVNLQIRKSIDGGASYANAMNGLGDAGNAANALFIAPFVMDPNNASTLVAGGTSIWRTTNSAGIWNSIRAPILFNPMCSAIGVKPGNSSEIWVGYTDGTVSRTQNGGALWVNVNNGDPWLPPRQVTDIAVSPFFADEAVVTFAGYNDDNVWATFDGGATWSRRTGAAPNDLPALQVNTASYHPANPNWLYIGTDLGVFASDDFGGNWNVTPRYGENEGPVNVEVDDLFFYGGQYLLAATHGRGMYRARPLDVIFVDRAYNGPENGSQAQPYNTVQEGIDNAGNGTTLSVRTGDYVEGPKVFFKRGQVLATGGTVVVR